MIIATGSIKICITVLSALFSRTESVLTSDAPKEDLSTFAPIIGGMKNEIPNNPSAIIAHGMNNIITKDDSYFIGSGHSNFIGVGDK